MATDVADRPTLFHISLNATSLARSIEFYRTLFDREPAKRHDDYAKFEVDDPPLVLSLVPRPPGPGGSLSHLGLRVPDEAALRATQGRLEAAGLATQCQDGTVCGYARQNKIWVSDPDRNAWEVYVVEEDVAPEAVRRSFEGTEARPEPAPEQASVVWEHFITAPLAERIPHDDATVDEVRLTGTFNARLAPEQLMRVVAESFRVLRPGGTVIAHGLMGNCPFPEGPPALPGLAAMVQRVPVQTEPVERFRAAGFVGVQFVKLTEEPWFRRDGIELREVKVHALKPVSAAGATRRVVYKGPFARAVDDEGNVYARGRRVAVTEATWEALRQGSAVEQFLFLDVPGGGDSACGAIQASPVASAPGGRSS